MINISLTVLQWFQQNKRELPWRNTKNPYNIWLSEIILQQTRVNQGLPYYERFIDHYPTVIDLANADEQEILKLWQGLGYYSRARNLHFTAKFIRDNYQGVFPATYQQIIELKGVGEYTASAISSIAYELPHAVVDGNVYRVLSRLFDIETPYDTTLGKKLFKELAQELLLEDSPGDFNQAMMEFGAIQCTPANPNCEICPLIEKCLAYQNNTIQSRPVKSKKIKIQKRFFYYLVYFHNNQLYLKKREENDIWKNLYDFPLIESKKAIKEENLTSSLNIKPKDLINKQTVKHILSHQHLHISFLWINQLPEKEENWTLVNINEIDDFPFPIVVHNYLKEFLIE